jgi:prophage regulatory protein
MNQTLQLLRLESTLSRRGRSRAQLYVDIKKGVFPPPVRLGARLSAWPSTEVDEVNRAEIRGATPDELRTLVQRLVKQRLVTITDAA